MTGFSARIDEESAEWWTVGRHINCSDFGVSANDGSKRRLGTLPGTYRTSSCNNTSTP